MGVTVEGVPIELTVAAPSRFGTELVRATGSPEYIASLGELPDGPTEEAVYDALGLPWIPPELREAPAHAVPPSLIELDDIRGDLHCHTTWSDGRASVLEMGEAARDRGYEYLAICDHTAAVTVVPGLSADDVRRQGEEIARANEQLAPFRILRGIECDIRPDGTLDLPDDVLAELDWVQISLHAGQRRSGEELTRIVTEAIRNPYASALSHPKGRILNHRPENALDLDAVFAVAVETGIALEINGLPDRLDLSDRHATAALAAGVDLVLNSDSHSTGGLASLEYSVATARRAAVPRERVVERASARRARTRKALEVEPGARRRRSSHRVSRAGCHHACDRLRLDRGRALARRAGGCERTARARDPHGLRARGATRAADAGRALPRARRGRDRDRRRGRRLADLGALRLSPRQPAGVRPARPRPRLPRGRLGRRDLHQPVVRAASPRVGLRRRLGARRIAPATGRPMRRARSDARSCSSSSRGRGSPCTRACSSSSRCWSCTGPRSEPGRGSPRFAGSGSLRATRRAASRAATSCSTSSPCR